MPKCMFCDSNGKGCTNDAGENDIYCGKHSTALLAGPEKNEWPEIYHALPSVGGSVDAKLLSDLKKKISKE